MSAGEDEAPRDPTGELSSLRREVETLRQRVAELQRGAARYDAVEGHARGAAAEAVSTREELLVEAERIARVGSWIWNIASDHVFWSDQLFRILGYDPARDVSSGAAFFERVHPEDRARVQQTSARCVETEVAEQIDFRLALPDGRVRFVTMNAAMLFDSSRRLRRVVGTVRDFTEERLLEQGMQRSLQLLEEAQRIAQMGHWTLELGTGKLHWSAGFYRVLGVDASTPASAELFFSRFVPEDRQRFEALLASGSKGNWQKEVEGRFVRPNGELRTARIRTIPIYDLTGAITEYRGTIVDVTEQVRLAERIAQVGKTEAVSRLAGGIAHDFNNLLTVIGANLEIWADKHGTEAEIADASQAVQSARVLTDRLLALGRRSHLARQVIDPNDVVSRTAELLRRVLGDQVSLGLALARELPAIDVDPTLIEQALINLVINARDAMLPAGGTITLSTRGGVDESGRPWVELEVADDGPGMAPDIKSRIFEPFFTTKGERGTGLGLPTVLGTVEQHQGSVEVDSEPGHGSRFRVRLPALGHAAEAAEAPPPSARQKPAPEQQVLVVEDEALVLAVISRSLERGGHRPLLARGAAEALALWHQHPSVELVICDVSMAEMRGPELVARLRQDGRTARVLYVTGYDAAGTSGSLGDPVLTKPFKPAELIRALSAL